MSSLLAKCSIIAVAVVGVAGEQGGNSGEIASAYQQFMRQGGGPNAGYLKFMDLYAGEYRQEHLDESTQKVTQQKEEHHYNYNNKPYYNFIKQHTVNSDDPSKKGYQTYMHEYMSKYKNFMTKTDAKKDFSPKQQPDIPVQGRPAAAPQGLAATPINSKVQKSAISSLLEQERETGNYRKYMLEGKGQQRGAGYRKYLASYLSMYRKEASLSARAQQQALVEKATAKYHTSYVAVPIFMVFTAAMMAAMKVSRPQYWRSSRPADSKTVHLLATEA